jgi:methyl coenzyme M reductase gamma subunit
VRQAVAAGVGLVLIILIVLGVKGCVDSRQENALKDYNRNVTAVVTESDKQVAQPYFRLLANGAREGQDLQVQINQLRQGADDQVRRAKGFDVPGEMAEPQDDLLLALDLRAEAIRRVAEKIPAAQGRGQPARQAIEQIAGQHQAFLASDVIYSQRVAPLIKEALDDAGITGQTIATSRSLQNLAWLSPDYVAERLGSGAAGTTSGAVAPGLHGHGLVSVSANGVALQPTGTSRVAASGGVTFRAGVANQGDNDERNVKVTVTVRGPGRPITVTKTIAQTKAKTTSEVSIPLGQAPPIGQAATVDVVVGRVPGEKKVDNNRQRFTVIFTR